MGKDAEQSVRGWRRHLRGVARSRAAKSGDDARTGTLFFSARELGTLAVNGLTWCFYVFITWGVIYLVITDRMPKLVEDKGPVNWLEASKPSTPEPTKVAGYLAAIEGDRDTCLQVIDEVELPDTTEKLSPDFQRGFHAATELILDRLEQK
jgi:hypothetical protein